MFNAQVNLWKSSSGTGVDSITSNIEKWIRRCVLIIWWTSAY